MTDAEITHYAIQLSGWLFGGIVTILAFITKAYINRVLDRVKGLEERERHYVTHEAIDKQILAISTEMKDGFMRMDKRLDNVDGAISNIHDRIDKHLDRRRKGDTEL